LAATLTNQQVKSRVACVLQATLALQWHKEPCLSSLGTFRDVERVSTSSPKCGSNVHQISGVEQVLTSRNRLVFGQQQLWCQISLFPFRLQTPNLVVSRSGFAGCCPKVSGRATRALPIPH